MYSLMCLSLSYSILCLSLSNFSVPLSVFSVSLSFSVFFDVSLSDVSLYALHTVKVNLNPISVISHSKVQNSSRHTPFTQAQAYVSLLYTGCQSNKKGRGPPFFSCEEDYRWQAVLPAILCTNYLCCCSLLDLVFSLDLTFQVYNYFIAFRTTLN